MYKINDKVEFKANSLDVGTIVGLPDEPWLVCRFDSVELLRGRFLQAAFESARVWQVSCVQKASVRSQLGVSPEVVKLQRGSYGAPQGNVKTNTSNWFLTVPAHRVTGVSKMN